MKSIVLTLCTGAFISHASNASEVPGPTGMLVNGVEWSIGDNEALPLVRGEKAAYLFSVGKGRVSLDVDGKSISNIIGNSGVFLEGKVITLFTKFSSGTAATGTIQRVSEFRLNSPGVVSMQAIQPAIFPLARFSIPRAFAFTVEGPPIPDRRPEECKDPLTSYVRLILDGETLKTPGASDTEARIPRNGGYLGKAKDIDWSIAGPSICTFTVMFSLVAD